MAVGGGGGVRHNFWEIWRGVRANLPLLRGEILCNISPCETHFSRPPPDNYCTVTYITFNRWKQFRYGKISVQNIFSEVFEAMTARYSNFSSFPQHEFSSNRNPKFLWRSVNGKHVMSFQSENAFSSVVPIMHLWLFMQKIYFCLNFIHHPTQVNTWRLVDLLFSVWNGCKKPLSFLSYLLSNWSVSVNLESVDRRSMLAVHYFINMAWLWVTLFFPMQIPAWKLWLSKVMQLLFFGFTGQICRSISCECVSRGVTLLWIFSLLSPPVSPSRRSLGTRKCGWGCFDWFRFISILLREDILDHLSIADNSFVSNSTKQGTEPL